MKTSELQTRSTSEILSNDNIPSVNEHVPRCHVLSPSQISSEDIEPTTNKGISNGVENDHNFVENRQNCRYISPNILLKKSFANINLDTLDYSVQNMHLIKQLMKKGQKELITLRKTIKKTKMQVHR
ncbi:uncharacterized protein LOC106644777 [Copidosoma floridanum]|uniref:uncharacterized protein LOC106644777 n=1 Tax=Copidosoma floridanum TaxID=29053 RepID=UPI0006C96417|nr:uncharacterized protein LOC106644777 [Copidosoma floridanum]